MKVAKPVVTLDKWVGRKSCCMTERRKSLDETHRPYIRPKRTSRYLPDSWDTKWINVKQYRNWKHRCRKKHQWEKHKQTPKEIERVTGHFPDQYIMYLYGRVNRWIEIHWDHMDDVERLIEEGKLEGGYVTVTYWGEWWRYKRKKYLKYARRPE